MKTNLEKLLKDKKIKQRDLAKAIGISEGTVSKYCNGSSEPDYKTLIDIANFLNVSIDRILNSENIASVNISLSDYEEIQKLQQRINEIYAKYR